MKTIVYVKVERLPNGSTRFVPETFESRVMGNPLPVIEISCGFGRALKGFYRAIGDYLRSPLVFEYTFIN